jgi:phosphoribosylanthranilate isomerase
MTKVKICGITNYVDAANAYMLGADYIGLNFYGQSLRFLDQTEAKFIIHKIPSTLKKIGIFVNEDIGTIKRILMNLELDLIQLHGDEGPEYCNKVMDQTKIGIIKAFRIRDEIDLEKLKLYNVDYFLFDTYREGLYGGTGNIFDLNLLKGVEKKFFVSGGLNDKNVKKTIEITNPFAVDTASGVEVNPRKKDIKKMEDFIKAAK